MVDYRIDWKYSRPTPQAESQRKYESGWERVFGKKSRNKPKRVYLTMGSVWEESDNE